MSEAQTNDTGADTIAFIQYHQPALPDGNYQITVTQTVATADPTKIAPSTFTTTRRFLVAGERCTIEPQQIAAVFPPAGSLGDHSNVLPHLMLKRSTLPWERQADISSTAPWLILLLFEDGEQLGGTIDKAGFLQKYTAANGAALWNYLLDAQIGWLKSVGGAPDLAGVVAADSRATAALGSDFAGLERQVEMILDQSRAPQVLPLSALVSSSSSGVVWPGLVLESSQLASDHATVIDVPKTLLEKLLPTGADLEYLAHVRRGSAGNGDEQAVIIGSRLPKQGGVSTLHLVSVERRYTAGGFDMLGARDDDLIRLISLHSWSFACIADNQSFTGLLTNLNHAPGTLRLPHNDLPSAEKYLAMGYVPLPHRLRQGGTTVSWYRGPLITADHRAEVTLPIRAADELLRYDPAIGLFDTSYAAAWELGRLLTLQNTPVATSLYSWKRAHAQQLAQIEQRVLHSHLPVQSPPIQAGEIPADIAAWFDSLRSLQGVPFNYLVPDERMLPKESIRFFWADHLWLDCLLDGAFSIGRVTAADHQREQTIPSAAATDRVTGFLLRSDVVAGWPGLLVDGFDAAGTQLPCQRMDRLSDSVLLCLFAGELSSVALALKPETLHFGLDIPADATRSFFKQLRDSQGAKSERVIDPMLWRHATERVIDIVGLANAMRTDLAVQPFTSAQFARQMIEGTPKIVFTKQAP